MTNELIEVCPRCKSSDFQQSRAWLLAGDRERMTRMYRFECLNCQKQFDSPDARPRREGEITAEEESYGVGG